MKLIFFSDTHLVPKFFKVVANLKKIGYHFQRQTTPFFFNTVNVLHRPSKIKLGKDLQHATKWTLGWMIYNIQAHLNPRWHLVIDQDACVAFWKQA